tara:strand:- start:238 stop:396 length:159 start_codon:yes stop_codon:yes gene_type:complete
MADNLEYWQKIKEDRLEDIQCQIDIGNPDPELMSILVRGLEEAEQIIEELNE